LKQESGSSSYNEQGHM